MLNARLLVSIVLSTYSFVAASCASVGSNNPVILGDPINATLPVPSGAISKSLSAIKVVILGLLLPLSVSNLKSDAGGLEPMLTTFCVPKEVTPGILVIPAPRLVPLRTVTPSILNAFPVARLMCSELVHACAARSGVFAVAANPKLLQSNT